MSEMQPLIALLEMMLNLSTPVVKVKAGGYAEDIFKELSEEEKENYECSICYQILKDPRMCLNNHKFCNSCIYVWATSGPSENHGRCPVCRTQGYYIKCREIGEKLDRKIVKCTVQSCSWCGPLRQLGSHQHTTYTKTGLPYKPTSQEIATTNHTDLPPLSSIEIRAPLSDRSNRPIYRLPDRQVPSGRPLNRNEEISILVRTPRHPPQGTTATTSSGTQGEGSSTRTPRPPSVPRPSAGPYRRRPTLPSIVNQVPNSSARSMSTSDGHTATVGPSVSENNRHDNNNNNTNNRPNTSSINNNNNSANAPSTSSLRQRAEQQQQQQQQTTQNQQQQTEPLQGPLLARRARMHAAPQARESEMEVNIRDRLRESRQRLDSLMSTFSTELDRGRRELTEFQEQRERRRQEQLSAVRDLGRRLGSVASELRLLLDQRRQLRDALPDTSEDL